MKERTHYMPNHVSYSTYIECGLMLIDGTYPMCTADDICFTYGQLTLYSEANSHSAGQIKLPSFMESESRHWSIFSNMNLIHISNTIY
jgi:hypothetical protein